MILFFSLVFGESVEVVGKIMPPRSLLFSALLPFDAKGSKEFCFLGEREKRIVVFFLAREKGRKEKKT